MLPNKKIAIWLFTCTLMVLLMVVVGGLTRLTESGLSIVYWKPIHGTIPPLNSTEWSDEFELYKSSPEYIKKNYNMELSEFKTIFWWEFAHRLLGRLIGIIFLLPLIYFIFKKQLSKIEVIKFLGIFALGGMQGFMGWYMVKSGLVDNPAVSHFRLAAHLSIALLLFSLLFWQGLRYYGISSDVQNQQTNYLKKLCNISIILLSVQIIFGAFLAGLDGGLIYNTWPSMNGEFYPDYTFDEGLNSIINNLTAIQFIHRWLAILVFAAILFLLIKTKKFSVAGFVPTKLRKIANIAHILVFLQVILGIYTLIYQVPIATASLHQINSVLLLGSLVYFRKRC